MYNPQKQNKPSFFERKKRRKFFCHSIITYKLVTFYYIHPFLKEKTLLFSFFLQKIFTSLQQNIIYSSTKQKLPSILLFLSTPLDITSLMHLEKTDYLLWKKKIKTFSKITYLIRYKSYVHLQRAKKP